MPIKYPSDFYIACPACKVQLRVRPSSGGYGSNVWSDGYSGSTKAEYCKLSSCPDCGCLFWVDELPKLGHAVTPTVRDRAHSAAILAAAGWEGVQVPFDESTLPQHDEMFVLPATNAQLLLAINAGITEPLRELYARKELWWRSNHPHRGITTGDDEPIPADCWNANLQWLLRYFESQSSDDRDVVIEAELLRELGRFEEAVIRMRYAVDSGAPRALRIKEYADARRVEPIVVRESDAHPIIY